jgi:hypothetical protein
MFWCFAQGERGEHKGAVDPSLGAQRRHPCRRCFAYPPSLPSPQASVLNDRLWTHRSKPAEFTLCIHQTPFGFDLCVREVVWMFRCFAQGERGEHKDAVDPSLGAQRRHPCRRCFAFPPSLPSPQASVLNDRLWTHRSKPAEFTLCVHQTPIGFDPCVHRTPFDFDLCVHRPIPQRRCLWVAA